MLGTAAATPQHTVSPGCKHEDTVTGKRVAAVALAIPAWLLEDDSDQFTWPYRAIKHKHNPFPFQNQSGQSLSMG